MRGRVAFAYDCVYPESVGGAERYYAALTSELARRGPVTYLTRHRWSGPRVIEREGVELIGVASGGDFRGGLAAHLVRHGGRYDVVHCAGFPAGAPVAAATGLRAHGTPLVVDWHEVLPRATWRRLRGRGGDARWALQQLGIRAAAASVVFSAMHERRVRAGHPRGPVARIPEFVPDRPPDAGAWQGPRDPLVVFLGRLVAEKRPWLVPQVVAVLRREDPRWSAVLFGDGPERDAVEEASRLAGVSSATLLAGFVPWQEVSATLARAGALLFPTEREGFGLVVLEAAAHGVPSVLVSGEDNAATELIDAGRNGVVCESADPEALAAAVLAVTRSGAPERARRWYEEASRRFSVAVAADEHERLHAALRAGAR